MEHMRQLQCVGMCNECVRGGHTLFLVIISHCTKPSLFCCCTWFSYIELLALFHVVMCHKGETDIGGDETKRKWTVERSNSGQFDYWIKRGVKVLAKSTEAKDQAEHSLLV